MHNIYTLSNTSASLLTPAGTHSGMDITIQNINSSSSVFIGGQGVTTSNYGFRLSPAQAISFELPGLDSLYAIAEENNAQIAVIKTNLEN